MTDENEKQGGYLVTPFPIKRPDEDQPGASVPSVSESATGPCLSRETVKKINDLIASNRDLKTRHQKLRTAYRNLYQRCSPQARPKD